MPPSVFSSDEADSLASRVRTLLEHLGYAIDHQRLEAILEARGLKRSPAGRFRFERELIDEFVAARIDAANRRDTARGGVPRRRTRGDSFRSSFGNEASKFYDYELGEPLTGRMVHLEGLAKLAHTCERIGAIGMPIIATDLPTATAPVEQLLALMKLTDKHPRRLEPYSAEQIPYFAELSDLLLGPGRYDEFIGQCDCINPILRLEHRTAGVMLAKAKYGVGTLMTSMPAAGGNAPVTVEGAVIQGTAEIVGGLIIAWLLLPEAHHRGYISSGALDFRSGVTTQSSPETVRIDCGVAEVMERGFGGDTGIGGKTYVDAKRPGLVAVYEKLFKSAAYASFGREAPYAGAGILDNGSLISPEQLLIDLEIGEALFRTSHPSPDLISQCSGDGPGSVVETIERVALEGKGDFLSSEHTLRHYREHFEPRAFRRGRTPSEEELLRRVHEEYLKLVGSYRGYEYNQNEVRGVEEILGRMKRSVGHRPFSIS